MRSKLLWCPIVLTVLVVACSRDLTEPNRQLRPDNGIARDDGVLPPCGEVDDPSGYLCDPTGGDPSDPYDELYYSYVDGGGDDLDQDVQIGTQPLAQVTSGDFSPSYSATASGIYTPICADWFPAILKHLWAWATPPGQSFPRRVDFVLTGVFTNQHAAPEPEGRYNVPPGYWPSPDGSGIEVQANTAVGVCSAQDYYVGPFMWRHFHFHITGFTGVNVRWPKPYSNTSNPAGGSGGSSGGGTGCRWEYIYIDVDYGDGTGWHEVWEGWAQVCG